MDKSTVKFALSVLDSQWYYMMEYDRTGSKFFKEQKSYYDGILRMAEICILGAFTAYKGVNGILTPSSSGREGKHCVLYANGKKLFADDE